MKEQYPKRVGIEVEDEQLSQDWVEAAKRTPERKKASEYPETLPKEDDYEPKPAR